MVDRRLAEKIPNSLLLEPHEHGVERRRNHTSRLTRPPRETNPRAQADSDHADYHGKKEPSHDFQPTY